mmetsp:Transcript_37085/g.81310  ORF Transcript_37085/g.81310 Transcript_37085/m.81310 type:complete len:233 (-) Transcript_37085:740-1438(-)
MTRVERQRPQGITLAPLTISWRLSAIKDVEGIALTFWNEDVPVKISCVSLGDNILVMWAKLFILFGDRTRLWLWLWLGGGGSRLMSCRSGFCNGRTISRLRKRNRDCGSGDRRPRNISCTSRSFRWPSRWISRRIHGRTRSVWTVLGIFIKRTRRILHSLLFNEAIVVLIIAVSLVSYLNDQIGIVVINPSNASIPIKTIVLVVNWWTRIANSHVTERHGVIDIIVITAITA